MTLDVVILAAGQGTRMKSQLPKVLQPLAGKPMLQWVIEAAQAIEASRIHVVIGHGADQVRERFSDWPVNWVVQDQQLGTGHALAQAMPSVNEGADVLVLYGDVPLIGAKTLEALLEGVSTSGMALLTATMDDPSGYGRIVRDTEAKVTNIVEQKDATPEQLDINEINSGILAARAEDFNRWLPALSADNAQAEYYLTDTIAMAVDDGMAVNTRFAPALYEIQGVNSRLQLQELERVYQRQCAEQLMANGVSLADANRIDIRGSLFCGQDVSIDVNCVFEGEVRIGNNVYIGPNCVISDSQISDGAEIKANSILEQAEVSEACVIGPFARLRPGTVLSQGVKIGNFVEVKKSTFATGSKANHLSYIGDSEIGSGVNIGAGTITCNYDGVNKHRTRIGDNAFIGSNTSLVAPVNVGAEATIGAGSTITGNIADGELAVARGKQRNIQGWKRPTKKSD